MINFRQRTNRSGSGQSVVEFAILLPTFMLLLLGMVEFGFVFAHYQGLEYATREGARTGSALANGQAGQNGYPGGTTCATIDNQIIAAVQRVVTGQGSLVKTAQISQIRIFKYDDGTKAPMSGFINVWIPGAGPTVDGVALKFKQSSGSWNPCTRDNGLTPDVLGVDISYTYAMITPLGSLLQWAGANKIAMADQTVMVLNP
jgi:hypothetical protein